jgi:hypothetical protein
LEATAPAKWPCAAATPAAERVRRAPFCTERQFGNAQRGQHHAFVQIAQMPDAKGLASQRAQPAPKKVL